MTALAATSLPAPEPGPASPEPDERRPVPRSPSEPARPPSPVLRGVGLALSFGALLVFGLLLYLLGLSSLSEARVQDTMAKSFTRALGQAVAPVGPTGEGEPVAILDIPRIGLRHAVVVEGTTARDLTRGPGLLRDSVLPGQAGISVVYGKRATFGAPFAHLMRLDRGDIVTVTTGQGVARYRVESFGDSTHLPPNPAPDQLVLMTANSPLDPTAVVDVSATLVSPARPGPGGLPVIGPDEHQLAGDPAGSLVPLLLWSQAFLLLSVVATVASHRWSRWPAYLACAPVMVAVLWNVYENVAGLLPNMY